MLPFNASEEEILEGVEEWIRTTRKGWHVDTLCAHLGIPEADANVIKCEYTRVFQGLFGGNVEENRPEQYVVGRSVVRDGDPVGLFGNVFSVTRRIYFSLENIPVVNSLQFWSRLDRVVLRNSKNPVVQNYLKALRQGFALRVA